MRTLIIILAILVYSFNGIKQSGADFAGAKNNEITLITCDVNTPLRIQYNKIHIEITKNYYSIKLHRISEPLSGYSELGQPKTDTTFAVDTVLFNQLLLAVQDINSRDIEFSLDSGEDGTTCKIAYGYYHSSISYIVWSPKYNSESRKTKKFITACEEILKAAKLNPKEIL